MMATGPVPDRGMSPAFVELMVPHAVGASECTIELEGRNGKLRIHWEGRHGSGPGGLETGLLFRLAEAALEHPDGIVKEVVYPVVNEQKLRDLVKEFKSTGPAYCKQVQTVMRNSWRSHYRRLLPRLLDTLEFSPTMIGTVLSSARSRS